MDKSVPKNRATERSSSYPNAFFLYMTGSFLCLPSSMRRGRDGPPPTTPTSPTTTNAAVTFGGGGDEGGRRRSRGGGEEEGSPGHHPSSLPVLRTRRQSFLVRAQLDEANKARDLDSEYISKLEKLLSEKGIDIEVGECLCV